MIQPTTPYMLRKDGKLLECGDIHPYLKSFGVEDMDNLLEVDDKDLQWYFDNSNQEIKNAVVDFRKNKTINNLNKLNELVNNEFCKVRTSNHKYKYASNNGEIYFRLCNTDNFNWYDVIWNAVAKEKNYIQTVTIMRDFETFGKQFDYCKVKGKEIKHMPVDEFLTMQGNPILESNENGLRDPTEEEIEKCEDFILDKLGNYAVSDKTAATWIGQLLNIEQKEAPVKEDKQGMLTMLIAALKLCKTESGIYVFKTNDGMYSSKRDFFILSTFSSVPSAFKELKDAWGEDDPFEPEKYELLDPIDYLN